MFPCWCHCHCCCCCCSAVGWGYEDMFHYYCSHYYGMGARFNMVILNHYFARHVTTLGKLKGPADWTKTETIDSNPLKQRNDFYGLIINRTDWYPGID